MKGVDGIILRDPYMGNFNLAAKAEEDPAATGGLIPTRTISDEWYGLLDGATIAVDWANGRHQSVTLAGNRTFTFAGAKNGERYLLKLKQDATGSRTVTWPTILWRGGSAPTLTTTASEYDVISLIYDGTNYYGDSSLSFS